MATISDFLENEALDAAKFYEQNKCEQEQVKKSREAYYSQVPIMEVKALSKIYIDKGFFEKGTEIKALNKISLELFKGESLGIVGESGCGKSTLSKCLVQLEKQNEGSILYKGTNIKELLSSAPLSYRKKVQMIFQDPASALNPKMHLSLIHI